jgi:hypothetical protein
VQNGTATATLNVPAGTPAGTYPIIAVYFDTTGTAFNTSSAPKGATLTVTPGSSQTALADQSAAFSTADQTVTLTATVTDASGNAVGEGNVTFTLDSLPPVTGPVNAQGVASAPITLMAGFAPGSYTLTASYADTPNAGGGFDVGPSDAPAATFTVNPAPATVSVDSASGAFNPTASQKVMLSATVNSGGAAVPRGTVAFSVAGLKATADVNPSGQASTILTLSPGFSAGSYPITATFADQPPLGGAVLFAAGQGSGTLNVAPAATQTALTTTAAGADFNSGGGQQVTVSATVSGSFGSLSEGTVTFTAGNASTQGDVHNGKATATLTLPPNFAAGSYGLAAHFTDSANPQGVNYADSFDTSGTLTVAPAATDLAAGDAAAAFSPSGPSVALHADVTSPTGGLVNGGQVTFSVAGVTVTAPVVNGAADTTATLPAGLPAGTYALTTSYADDAGSGQPANFTGSKGGGTLTVGTATTQLSVAGASVASGGQSVTLTATVGSAGGPVSEGVVTFTVAGATASAPVSGGRATAALTLPGGLAAGQYPISALFTDGNNAGGQVNLAPSSGAGTLTVLQTSTVTITQVSLTPGFGFVTETVTAQVGSPGGPVDGGTVTFSIGGVQVQAAVHNGTVTATARVSPLAVLGAQGVSASYGGTPAAAGSSGSRTVVMNFFDALEGSTITLRADGSEVVAIDFFGIPLLMFFFDAAGNLTGVTFAGLPLFL